MKPHPLIAVLLAASVASPLLAGTILITSLPDTTRPLAPLASLDGGTLAPGSEIRVGAFPGMTDEAILSATRQGGFTGIETAFMAFGSVHAIGDGADGQAGTFEVAVRQAVAANSPLAGEQISILVRKGTGEEFLLARFKDRTFTADPETGLEPLLSLHLAEAKIIAGDRYGTNRLSTAPPTAAGSFTDWIAGFQGFDYDDRLPGADPDRDGRINFLEYATGGNPNSGSSDTNCTLVKNAAGIFEIQFSRMSGIGIIPTIEWSPDLVTPWVPLEGTPEPAPEISAPAGVQWLKMSLPENTQPKGFFRLRTASGS